MQADEISARLHRSPDRDISNLGLGEFQNRMIRGNTASTTTDALEQASCILPLTVDPLETILGKRDRQSPLEDHQEGYTSGKGPQLVMVPDHTIRTDSQPSERREGGRWQHQVIGEPNQALGSENLRREVVVRRSYELVVVEVKGVPDRGRPLRPIVHLDQAVIGASVQSILALLSPPEGKSETLDYENEISRQLCHNLVPKIETSVPPLRLLLCPCPIGPWVPEIETCIPIARTRGLTPWMRPRGRAR